MPAPAATPFTARDVRLVQGPNSPCDRMYVSSQVVADVQRRVPTDVTHDSQVATPAECTTSSGNDDSADRVVILSFMQCLCPRGQHRLVEDISLFGSVER